MLPRKPNLFIVGAPKCGTTALYRYLSLHPNIFMARIKEPHFFARDLGTYPRIKTADQYGALFTASRSDHTVLGEASVYYLRSAVAVPNIREFNPDAKIIAMFRNPVDMVHALHSQLLYVGEETVEDFETAWRLQPRRNSGLDLPPRIRSPLLVQYREIGRLGTQAERVLSYFPSAQVKFILYDDFTASLPQVYREVLEFLDVPPDDRTEFPRINENKRAKIGWLGHLSRKPPPRLRRAFHGLKRVVGAERLSAVKKRIAELNTATERRPPLSPSFRAELVDTFREEVGILSRLLNRDLSHWV